MSWLDNIGNIEQPNINISNFVRDDMPNYIIEKHKENSGSWWLNSTTIIFFLYCVYAFSKKNGFIQAIMISSFCAWIISITFLLNNFSYSAYSFFLFSIIWMTSVIVIYNGKENNKL